MLDTPFLNCISNVCQGSTEVTNYHFEYYLAELFKAIWLPVVLSRI